ncbi:MAG: DUF1080 domain-containing protein [Planctomycetota bacterium]|nr:DUF1080 domain-containing protein [Planctomycetota bacterium]
MPLGAVHAAEPKHNTLTDKELADGWILLFDGETLYGWKPNKEADWEVVDGTIRASKGKPTLLTSTSEYANYELKVDFKASPKTNSGVFLRVPQTGGDIEKNMYELNIAPADNPYPTGSLVRRKRAAEVLPDDAWHTFDVTADGGHVIVKLDGKQVLSYFDPIPAPAGRIALQFNEGPIQFRSIKLRPLGTKSIFNGRDLAGWKVYPEAEKKKSVYSVTDNGELNVKNGPGSLESEGKYADFLLQFEVFSNGKHLNSGVFFRSIPGEFTNGYECQIHNGYKDGDRTKPLDYGTGGFYRRQPARLVNSDDFKWVPITLNVTGNHMAAWVNGVQVSDWTDTRKPDSNPRKGLRTEAGTLSIQGHDPTTDLSFRKLRIVEFPTLNGGKSAK